MLLRPPNGFGRVPVGFGPEGPAISDHDLLKGGHGISSTEGSKLATACSQALCNWLRFGLAETGAAFNHIRFEASIRRLEMQEHRIILML